MKYNKFAEGIDNDHKLSLDRLFNLLDILSKKGVLDKITKKITELNQPQMNEFTYIKEDGMWKMRINVGNRYVIETIDDFDSDGIDNLYYMIMNLINMGDVMKKINECKLKYIKRFESLYMENHTHEESLKRLTNLLDLLEEKNILDKVIDTLMDTGLYREFSYVRYYKNEWCIRITYESGSLLEGTKISKLSELPQHSLDQNYDNIMNLINVGDVMKKINK